MTGRPLPRSVLGLLAVVGLAILVALPAVATHTPGHSPPGQGNKPDKSPAVQVTLRGPVSAVTDAEGKTSYRLSAGGKTYELDAGPSWFHGDNHPLKAFVGKTVTIVGGQRGAALEIDVESVDGTVLRAPGKPAWAGGWKRVGKAHPGWSQEKVDRMNAKFGDCFPPGQCKEKPAKPAESPAP